MNCKKVYLGQEIENEEWSYGLGLVYLAGPRNPKGKSWILDVISKLKESGTPMAIFIPETKSQLRGGFNKSPSHVIYDWQRFAMSIASAIIFFGIPRMLMILRVLLSLVFGINLKESFSEEKLELIQNT